MIMAEKITFNELPDEVANISTKLGVIETLLRSLNLNPVETPNDNRFTLSEAAEYCRMAEPTFRTYLRRREVGGCKLGKSWLFTKADLDTFLNCYRAKTSTEIAEMSNQILKRAKK